MSYIISGKDRGCITYLSGVNHWPPNLVSPDVELNADGRETAASMRGRVKKYGSSRNRVGEVRA
jgi:hypothetical protein